MYDEKVYQYHSTAQKKETNGNRGTGTVTDRNGDHGSENGHDEDVRQTNNAGIVVRNATARWTDVQTENSLENVNLTVRPGRLVAVIGPVGAGKVFLD